MAFGMDKGWNRIWAVVALGSVFFCLTACGAARRQEGGDTSRLIIFYDGGIGKRDLLEAVEAYGSEIVYQYKNFNGITVTVPRKKSLEKTIRYYKQVEGVLSVTKDRAYELLSPDG